LRLPASLAIIVAIAYFFALPMLDFNSELTLEEREFEPNAGLIANGYHAIRDGVFPWWNPYVHTGIPYIGDPANYFLNPVGSIPGLILGPINGPKIGVFLAVALAGFSGYYFAAALNLSWPARMWAAAFMAFNGHLAARIFVGQFQLAIAFPFMVAAFPLYIDSLRKPGRQYAILLGVCVAMTLYSGLLYYFLFLVPGLAITFIFFAVGSQLDGWDPARLLGIVRQSLVGAAWALGFSAVILIPFYETRDFVIKDVDPLLRHSQTIKNSFLNFLHSEREYYQPAARGKPEGFLGEYYSYVGLVPVIAAPFALLALRRKEMWVTVPLLGVLFAGYMVWSSAAHTPVQYVYERFTFLYNFRWTSRVLAAATPFLIMLAAVGIDELWKLMMHPRFTIRRRRLSEAFRTPAVPVGALVAAAFLAVLAYNAYHVFTDNKSLFRMIERRSDHAEVAAWFEANDVEPGFYQVGDGSVGVIARLTANEIVQFAPVYWDPQLRYGERVDPTRPEQLIHPKPHYTSLALDAALPPDALEIGVLDQEPAGDHPELVWGYMYRLTESPPMASLVSRFDPPVGEAPWGERAQPATLEIVDSNTIEVQADLSDERYDSVLLLQSYFPGWRVEVDGEDAGAARNMRGYVSTEALPGEHTYRFIFDPATFKAGLAITLGTAVGALLIGVTAIWAIWKRRAKPEAV
jgi:hypothetical protein